MPCRGRQKPMVFAWEKLIFSTGWIIEEKGGKEIGYMAEHLPRYNSTYVLY